MTCLCSNDLWTRPAVSEEARTAPYVRHFSCRIYILHRDMNILSPAFLVNCSEQQRMYLLKSRCKAVTLSSSVKARVTRAESHQTHCFFQCIMACSDLPPRKGTNAITTVSDIAFDLLDQGDRFEDFVDWWVPAQFFWQARNWLTGKKNPCLRRGDPHDLSL